jgi:hypothetical protein
VVAASVALLRLPRRYIAILLLCPGGVIRIFFW